MENEAEDGESRRSPSLWLYAGAVLIAIVAVSLVAVLMFSTRQRDSALRAQERSYELMVLAGTFDATMVRAEATLGRFVISGDKNQGRLYSQDWRRASAILDSLTKVAAESPTQADLVKRLREVYNVRGLELADTSLRTNYNQNEQALAAYYKNGKSETVPLIDWLVARIIDNERQTLASRSRVANVSIARSNALTAALAAAGLLLVLGAVFLGWRVIEGLADRRDEELRANELEFAVSERTSELRSAYSLLQDEMESREGAEAALRQVQKMEAVGQLTGGIAHDFNNMLAVVIGGLELAQRRLGESGSEVRRHIDNAMEGANRAATLTKRLLSFARAEPLLPLETNPDALIRTMSEMLDRTLGDAILIEIEAKIGNWRVLVDRHQLESAILNLAVNSRDAMERGGTLTIATSQVTVGDDEMSSVTAGDYVQIDVRDNGAGMSPKVIDRVFEPFFTTKPAGKGTGLGLSQTFAFVRQSGGVIGIESTVGEGTTVSILLPRYQGASTQAEHLDGVEPAAPAFGHKIAILVVEDDRRVLAANIAALTELGHHPIACSDAREAPALLSSRPEVSLVLSDVLMPEITGPELVATLRRQRPGIAVIYATGFAGDVEDAAAFGGDQVLRKPFTIATLEIAIANALLHATEPV